MKDNQKWYFFRVVSGQEKAVKSRLEIELEQYQLKDYIGRIVIPVEKVYVVRSGKRQLRNRNVYPGYLVILADLEDGRLLHLIKEVPGALGFLGVRGWKASEPPIPLSEEEVNKILLKMEDENSGEISLDQRFIIGEMVKIIDGPFSGFSGAIQEIFDERKKLNVIVKIFERNTPVELTYGQVEKI